MPKVLYVHRSERADYLAEALGEVLSGPLADPMAHEVVAVPTRGVERWLSQRLGHRLGASQARGGGGAAGGGAAGGGAAGGGAAASRDPSTAGVSGDGVCANFDWPFPGALIAMATATAIDRATASAPPDVGGPRPAKPGGFTWWLGRQADPWRQESLAWAVALLIDEHLDDPFMQPLRDHLQAASPERKGLPPRRFAIARHIADLLDTYAVHRPEMLLSWLQVTDTSARWQDAAASARYSWQAELYRLLCRRIPVPGPAQRLEAAASLIESSPDLLAPLPPRLSCFGLTRLPPSHLKVLRAIAAHRDVHLFLLHPSGALWDKVAATNPKPPGGLERAKDTTSDLAANPLLRSWGRDAREMQLVLAAQDASAADHRPVGEGPNTLLGHIQADIRADRPPPGPPAGGEEDLRPFLDPDDDSLQVHACHGRARQVEVVREAVLHLLAAHPALEPRDVIVMCPDIEEFAPLIKTTFATASLGGGPQVRAKLADRSIRQTNPVLAVTAQLLDLASSRVTATQVMDLVSVEPVRRRFGFDEEALASIERWVGGSGVRWGLDEEHREAWKLGSLASGTWRAGVDRLLLGIAMGSDVGVFKGTLPHDDIVSDEIGLAGRFAELLERLRSSLEAMRSPQPIGAWAEVLSKATYQLADVAPGQEWQFEQLARGLEEMLSSARLGLSAVQVGDLPGDVPRDLPGDVARDPPGDVPRDPPGDVPRDLPAEGPLLDAAEVRGILADRLRGNPTRANFRTGEVTICTLVPMRSVPHKVVCLLGLDDGAFPRSKAEDGDNLLLSSPCVGDRDASSEDRQLLLDALLAATEHLVITYEGHDLHLNRRRPPSVPVAELLDVVDQTVRLQAAGRRAREAVTFEHPLQPFDPRNYTPGAVAAQGTAVVEGAALAQGVASGQDIGMTGGVASGQGGGRNWGAKRGTGPPFCSPVPDHPVHDHPVHDHPVPDHPVHDDPLPTPQGREQPWRFDPLNLRAAEVLAEPQAPPRPFLTKPLAPLGGRVVQLASLIRWLEHPTKAFLRERLGYYAEGFPEPLQDALPLELGPLERWALGDRLLMASLSGENMDEACAIEQASGLLPPGAAGRQALQNARLAVEALAAARQMYCPEGPGERIEVHISLPDGRALIGSVPDVHSGTVLRCVYSRLHAKHRLRAWAQFLALSACRPELRPSAITIGQSEGSRPGYPRTCTQLLEPWPGDQQSAADAALDALSDLISLYDAGMREPLPIYCATSAAWAEAARPEGADNPRKKAKAKWGSGYDEGFGEASEPEHMVVLGGKADFEDLLEGRPVPAEVGAEAPGTGKWEESRFSLLARRLWGPLLAHEKLRER